MEACPLVLDTRVGSRGGHQASGAVMSVLEGDGAEVAVPRGCPLCDHGVISDVVVAGWR